MNKKVGDLELDFENRCAIIHGAAKNRVWLSEYEFRMLALLVDSPGCTVLTSRLVRVIWHGENKKQLGLKAPDFLRTLAHRLRNRLSGDRIKPIRGRGYMLEIQ